MVIRERVVRQGTLALSVALILIGGSAVADEVSDRQEQRADRRGDRIEERLDRKGDRIEGRCAVTPRAPW